MLYTDTKFPQTGTEIASEEVSQSLPGALPEEDASLPQTGTEMGNDMPLRAEESPAGMDDPSFSQTDLKMGNESEAMEKGITLLLVR